MLLKQNGNHCTSHDSWFISLIHLIFQVYQCKSAEITLIFIFRNELTVHSTDNGKLNAVPILLSISGVLQSHDHIYL